LEHFQAVINNEPLFSLQQVAERLGLRVRTVRSYVRAGRLKAVRIGKQYRVAREDIESIAGPHGWDASIASRRCAEVSSVVQADAVSQEAADRITDHLRVAVKAPRDDGSELRVEAIYDRGHARIRVIVIGSLSAASAIFALMNTVLDADERSSPFLTN
jgi:excisionase family DNA binding protein